MNSVFTFLFTKTPLVFFAQSIWRDEAFSSLLSQKNIGEMLSLTAKDSNPPLYYLLLHYWMKFFGNSEIALRSVSLIFFCLGAYVFFLFLRNIFNHSSRRSAIYLSLFVVNPVLHYYAFEARMYTMFGFFALASYYFFLKKNYKFYSIFIFLGLLTHYFMIFVLLSQILYLYSVRKKTNNNKTYLRSLSISCLLFLPWILFVLISKPSVNNSFWITKPKIETLIQLPGIIFTGYEPGFQLQYSILTLISILLTIILYSVSLRTLKLKKSLHDNKSKNLILYLFIWSLFIPLIILVVSFIKPIFLPRYLIFSTMGLLLFFSYILPKTHKFTEIALFTILITISLIYAQIQTLTRTKANIREVAKVIKALIKPDDVVYVTHEFNFHPLQYYINNKQIYIYGKTYEQLPWYIGKVLISPDNIAQSLPVYPKKAFILNDDLTFSIQATY